MLNFKTAVGNKWIKEVNLKLAQEMDSPPINFLFFVFSGYVKVKCTVLLPAFSLISRSVSALFAFKCICFCGTARDIFYFFCVELFHFALFFRLPKVFGIIGKLVL